MNSYILEAAMEEFSKKALEIKAQGNNFSKISQ
jgi:hypothetical protein